MNHIDFLPDQYHDVQRRRRRISREVLLIVTLALGVAVWMGLAERRLGELGKYAEAVETQIVAERQQVAAVKRLREKHASLVQQVTVRRKLSAPVQASTLLASLGACTPESVTLLLLDAHAPAPKPEPKEAEPARSSRRRAEPEREIPRMTLTVEGVAPDGETVADMFGRLSDHALFDEVTMNFSRAEEVASHKTRRFRLSMSVRLDRIYRVADAGVSGGSR